MVQKQQQHKTQNQQTKQQQEEKTQQTENTQEADSLFLAGKQEGTLRVSWP